MSMNSVRILQIIIPSLCSGEEVIQLRVIFGGKVVYSGVPSAKTIISLHTDEEAHAGACIPNLCSHQFARDSLTGLGVRSPGARAG